MEKNTLSTTNDTNELTTNNTTVDTHLELEEIDSLYNLFCSFAFGLSPKDFPSSL